jgi:hypothetical protein
MIETIRIVEKLLVTISSKQEKTTSTSDVKMAAQLLADQEALLMFYNLQKTEATYAIGQAVYNAANAACPGAARAANAALAMMGRLPLMNRQVEVCDVQEIGKLNINDLMRLRESSTTT